MVLGSDTGGTAVPDEVRKRIHLPVPRERVWRALTEPEDLRRWFPTQNASVDLREGGVVRFTWEESSDEGVIEELVPAERLVFRWRVEGSGRPYTRVVIALVDGEGGGTDLTLVETGFSALGREYRAGNDRGWTEELEELRLLMAAEAA